jgi:hypothetical protein
MPHVPETPSLARVRGCGLEYTLVITYLQHSDLNEGILEMLVLKPSPSKLFQSEMRQNSFMRGAKVAPLSSQKQLRRNPEIDGRA